MKKRRWWSKEEMARYFEESRELEADRRPRDQADLNTERYDVRKDSRRRSRKVRRITYKELTAA